MVVAKFYNTVQSKLDDLPVQDGNLIFIEDAHKIALDLHNKRTEYTQFIDLETDDQRTGLLAPLDTFYFVKSTAILWRYSGGWMQITSPPNSWISDEFPPVGQSSILYINMTLDKVYRWDDNDLSYHCLSGVHEDEVELISGGSSI